jgi:sugar lactone lactonase YvrE
MLRSRLVFGVRTLTALVLVALVAACATSPRATQRVPVIVTRSATQDSVALQIAVETAIRDSIAAWRDRLSRGDTAGPVVGIGRLAPRMTAFAAGFDAPESARYDADLDVFFVSNLNGPPTAKDDNGYISTVSPDGTVRNQKLVHGAENDVTLNAPKGLCLTGDTLWVTDIDVVRAFDKRSGKPLATISFGDWKPTFLNDITVGPDGALYVTEMARRMDAEGRALPPGPSRVFRVGAGGAVTLALESERLGQPNGITLDRAHSRLLIAPSGSDTIFAWTPGSADLVPLAVGPGQYDGIEVLADGRVLVTSWAQSAVLLLEGGRLSKLIDVQSPADIGLDSRRNLLAVPVLLGNRVNFYDLSAR